MIEPDTRPSRDAIIESEAHGQPRDRMMRVVGGLECFSGGGRCAVLVIQFRGEVREAVLRERSDPFRDHDGRSGL